MEAKTVRIKYINNNKVSVTEMIIYEEACTNKDEVKLELNTNNDIISIQKEYFFEALIELRRILEDQGMILECNGAARNVYPSPMQISMGGSKAYKLLKGKQAKLTDVVDIFDYDPSLEYVAIDEQLDFYNEWLESLKNN
ncbi:hypothetical protein [Paenibacillus roseipurpureus]|uniref:Uncharacterized protein n=1 Tax=Paenibacillus roseopurpureus TaxID=2918901 RepID=A0AA96LPN4_9BACL|nr:hypothetical protein [Paenibacillus sp. MBLB1832]WNR43674.1 hypothetical protein MJB10_21615 [Paenibacillus sp. MBLB1832]